MSDQSQAPDQRPFPRRADRRAAESRSWRSPRRAAPRTGRSAPRREATAARRDYFLIALIVLGVAKVALSRFLGLGTANPLGVLLEVAAIVLVLCGVDVVWPKRSYAFDLAAYSVLSLVMLGNVMYVSFFGEIVSPKLLSVAGQAGDVSSTIQEILRPIYLLYVIDIPVLAVWASLTWRARREASPRPRLGIAIAASAALAVFAVQVALVMGLPASTDGNAIALTRGFASYQVASVFRLLTPDPATSAAAAFEHVKNETPAEAAQAQIDALRHADLGSRIADFPAGAFKGKNVIIIQVEALQDLVIGKSYDGQVISPNLNKLAAQSWYFPNTYSETSAGNTVDAEFTVNTSLYAPTDGAASLEYADRQLPGLPRLLRAKGYDAITLHVNDVRFWNRIELYPALGFRRYWDRSYFQNRDKMWHASDQILFSYGMKVLNSEAASSSPFYSFFITESSHVPYKAIPIPRWQIKLSAADQKTLSGKYVGSISYTDMAIGEFEAALKKSGLWDKSIVVIYGDHSALLDKGPNKGDSTIADTILGRPYTDVDHQRIPLIIHLPGQTQGHMSTKPDGQVDVMPTIADLVGLNLSQVPHFGRSVFVDSPSLVPTRAYLPGGSFIDDSALFMPGLGFDDGKAVNVNTAASTPLTSQMRAEYSATQKLDLISDAWVKSLPKRPDANGAKNAIIPH